MQKAIANGCLNVRNIGAKGANVLEYHYILLFCGYNFVFNTCNWHRHTLYRIERKEIYEKTNNRSY